MTRTATILLIAFCPMLGGCLALPYAYPRVEHLPEVTLEQERNEVRAFLVTKTYTRGNSEKLVVQETGIEEVALKDGAIPSRTDASFGRGAVGLLLFFIPFAVHSTDSTELRLYRPGYDVVVVKPWESQKPIGWRPLRTLREQEEALNRIFCERHLECSSPDERRALMYLAGEHERLAALAQSDQEIQKLTLRANNLRDIAAGRTKATEAEKTEDKQKSPEPSVVGVSAIGSPAEVKTPAPQPKR